MARLMLAGTVAQVELAMNDEAELWEAKCRLHPAHQREHRELCRWTERYDTLRDASEYAADHADRGVR